MVKNLPAVQGTWVQSLGLEDPLEKEWLPTPVFLPGESHGQFQPPAFYCRNSYISLFLPYLFRAVPQSYLRGCFPGLGPQSCLPNKT